LEVYPRSPWLTGLGSAANVSTHSSGRAPRGSHLSLGTIVRSFSWDRAEAGGRLADVQSAHHGSPHDLRHAALVLWERRAPRTSPSRKGKV